MFRRFSWTPLVISSCMIMSLFALTVATPSAHATDGHRDTAFGTSGVASVSISPNADSTSDMVVQSDGKIIVAGTGYYGPGQGRYDFVLARFNTDGTLDNSFSTDGKVNTNFVDDSTDELNGIALQSDGKILATGWSNTAGVTYMVVARYKSDGSLDDTFDGDGKVFISALNPAVEDFGTEVLVQTDGKIVIVGAGYDDTAQHTKPFVVRLFSNGGTDYISVINTAENASASAGALQSNGQVVLAGMYGNSSDNLGIWRVDTNGSLDTNFGIAGSIISANASYASAVAIQNDGKIVVGGAARGSSYLNSSVHRYSSNGVLDPTFSGDGIFETSLVTLDDYVNDVAIRPDGTIVVVGQAQGSGGNNSFAAQITSTGSLDNRYSADGYEIISIGAFASRGIATAIQSDGKILMAVIANFGINGDLAVMRINPPSTIATLSSLVVSGATLNEAFSGARTTYSAAVTNATSSITMTPTVTNSYSTVKVNGSTVTSGTASAAVPLTVGANSIPVVVTAQDGVSQTTYTITVTRAAAVDSSSGNTSSGTATTTLPTTTTVAAKAPPTVKVKKTITAASVLASKDIALASTSKIVITVKTSSKKYCSVTATKVKGVKKGNCTVVVSVTPKATKTVKKPKTTKTTVTIRVV